MTDYRWIVLGTLFVARFCLGYQFQSAGSVGPFLITDFGLDYLQVGTLVGLYMLPGLLVAIPGGVLGKRFGDKQVVMAGICGMIVGGVLSGAGTSYAMVSVGRVISGIGAAFLFVLMTKMIVDWFDGKDLFVGMALFIIGWPVGIAAAQATQSQLGQAIGWNAVFYLTAAMLTVSLMLMAVFYRPASVKMQNGVASSSRLNRTEIWLVCIAGWIWMLLNSAYQVMLTFGPTLLMERGASVVEADRVVSLMSWVFFFALPLGGYLATRFKAPNHIMVVGLVSSVVFGLLIPIVGQPSLTFALFGIAFAVATPVIAALPAEALKPENRATGLGIYYLWYYGGVAVAPAVGGFLKDVTHTAAISIYFATAMMFGCLCLLGIYRLEQSRLSGPTS